MSKGYDVSTSSEVNNAMIYINEKKRICKACVMNNNRCTLQAEFHRNYKSRSCPSFKLRKEGFY